MAKGRPNKGTGTTGPKKPGNSNKVRKYSNKKGL